MRLDRAPKPALGVPPLRVQHVPRAQSKIAPSENNLYQGTLPFRNKGHSKYYPMV